MGSTSDRDFLIRRAAAMMASGGHPPTPTEPLCSGYEPYERRRTMPLPTSAFLSTDIKVEHTEHQTQSQPAASSGSSAEQSVEHDVSRRQTLKINASAESLGAVPSVLDEKPQDKTKASTSTIDPEITHSNVHGPTLRGTSEQLAAAREMSKLMTAAKPTRKRSGGPPLPASPRPSIQTSHGSDLISHRRGRASSPADSTRSAGSSNPWQTFASDGTLRQSTQTVRPTPFVFKAGPGVNERGPEPTCDQALPTPAPTHRSVVKEEDNRETTIEGSNIMNHSARLEDAKPSPTMHKAIVRPHSSSVSNKDSLSLNKSVKLPMTKQEQQDGNTSVSSNGNLEIKEKHEDTKCSTKPAVPEAGSSDAARLMKLESLLSMITQENVETMARFNKFVLREEKRKLKGHELGPFNMIIKCSDGAKHEIQVVSRLKVKDVIFRFRAATGLSLIHCTQPRMMLPSGQELDRESVLADIGLGKKAVLHFEP